MWGEGYFNGTDSIELSLRRSLQLQELFAAMNANRGAAPQSSEASVSLQDLTQTEWFYMYCMACSYATGVGYSLTMKCKTISPFLWISKCNFHNLVGRVYCYLQKFPSYCSRAKTNHIAARNSSLSPSVAVRFSACNCCRGTGH